MDNQNRFESKWTYMLLRAEYFFGLIVCLYLLQLQFHEIRWSAFAFLFLYIDLIGYIPGAVAYRLRQSADIPRIYYLLYNSTHSLVSAGVVAGVWSLVFKPEWALLALPIHLFGDRALFGNFLKPFFVSFEPEAHPAFTKFEREIHSNQWG